MAKLDAQAALGIDVGGTGVKAALVDPSTGELVSKRVRLATPKPATPEAVIATIAQVVEAVAADREPFAASMPVGCGLPAPIKDGTAMAAANIDKGWIGLAADEQIAAALGRRVFTINDADAAGLAEVRLGAGRDVPGTVIVLTIGTGIGSAIFSDGRLLPNTELGHLEFKGRDAETRISGVARDRRRLRWKGWAAEFNEYLAQIERLFWPDLIILGGGVSKVMSKYKDLLSSRAPIVPAHYLNTAGIIGAAMHATDQARLTRRG